MRSNLVSKCLTFYALPETCPAEAVLFNVVNGFWFSSTKKKKERREKRMQLTPHSLQSDVFSGSLLPSVLKCKLMH